MWGVSLSIGNEENVRLFLSIYDLVKTLQKNWRTILFVGCLSGIFLFTHYVQKPLAYTAEGIFKSSQNTTTSTLSKALEFVGSNESFNNLQEDPKTFLRTYPIAAKVVRSLNLQAKLTELKVKKKPFKTIFETLKAELLYSKLKKARPDSLISCNEPVPFDSYFENSKTAVICKNIWYKGSIARVFLLNFTEESSFEVFDQGKKIGIGSMDEFFEHNGCRFLLQKSGQKTLKKRSFYLTVIPEIAASKSLEAALIVKKDKENSSLLHIYFTHSDPELASSIVNATMSAYQEYVKEQGAKKAAQQLGYLKQRQKEAYEDLEMILHAHKEHLIENVKKGEMATSEKELDVYTASYRECKSALNKTALEMQTLQKSLPQHAEKSFKDLLASLEVTKNLSYDLTCACARQLLFSYQTRIEEIQREKRQYLFCAEKLFLPDFDSSSFSLLLKDASLTPCFEKVHNLNRNLIDEKNWTENERLNLKNELLKEKKYLGKCLENLTNGAEVEEAVLKKSLLSLQETLLFLLYKEYAHCTEKLHLLAEEGCNFPEKWMAEKKIDLSQKMHSEVTESVTKLIEAKNLGYHLEFLQSSPLMESSIPPLPNCPKLFLKFKIGLAIGSFLAAFIFLAKEIYLGVSASMVNLRALGAIVAGPFESLTKKRDKKTLDVLVHHLNDAQKIAVLSKKSHFLCEALFETFLRKGEEITIIEKEDCLNSENRCIFSVIGNAQNFEIDNSVLQADAVVYLVFDERIQDLPRLDSILFLSGPVEEFLKPPISFSFIRPILEKLLKKLSFFSSSLPSSP